MQSSMQSAQISSPRFSYQTAAPAPQTLDDFRVTQDNYAGSFSGKSKRPVWIAVVMIAAVGGIAFGVNQYSETHVAKITSTAIGPVQGVPPASSAKAPTSVPLPTAVPGVTGNAATDPLRSALKSAEPLMPPLVERSNSSEAINATRGRSNVTAKSAVVAPKKAAPIAVAPRTEVAPPQLEMAPPPSPSIQEPAPTPAPIIEEKPVVPTPAPNVPPAESPKQ